MSAIVDMGRVSPFSFLGSLFQVLHRNQLRLLLALYVTLIVDPLTVNVCD